MAQKHLVITIEREYGSGGRIVGKKLAADLGMKFYDDEILTLASERSAVGEQYFRLADEKAGKNLFHKLMGGKLDVLEKPDLEGRVTTPENLFRFQSAVIRELAREEACVIVGRAAGYVVALDKEIDRLIRIFVCAGKAKKIERVMEVDTIDEERAKRRIKKVEKSRKEYYKYFTGSEWHNMKNYDLTINTTNLELPETAELVKEYIRLKGFDK